MLRPKRIGQNVSEAKDFQCGGQGNLFPKIRREKFFDLKVNLR